MNPAEREMRGWAWNCGAGILPLVRHVIEGGTLSEKAGEVPGIVRQLVTRKQNEQSREVYERVRDLIHQLSLDARLVVKVPKTLPALRRDPHPFQRVERDLYREFHRYGIAVAEVIPFAFKIGVFGLVRQRDGYSEGEKHEVLEAWENAALRAEEDFARYEELFRSYLDSDMEGSRLVSDAADIFYQRAPTGKAAWHRIWEAVMLRPNIHGVGLDLKKLKSRSRTTI